MLVKRAIGGKRKGIGYHRNHVIPCIPSINLICGSHKTFYLGVTATCPMDRLFDLCTVRLRIAVLMIY